MKALITGAAGFIGNALAKTLANAYDVTMTDILPPAELFGCKFIQADLTDIESVKNLPDVDIVFHFCAYNNTSHFYTKPMSVINNTLVPTINLINRYTNVKKFVYASSSEIYAGGVDLGLVNVPTDEVNIGVINGIDNPRWSYAGSKLMGELLIHAAHVEHNLDYLIIRFHNVYGKNQKSHFIPEYVDRLLQNDNVLYGANQTRAFLYIDDAIDIVKKLSDITNNDTINVGNPNETSISDTAAIIRKYLGITATPILKPSPDGSVVRRCADLSKMTSMIGDYNFTSLDQGLKKLLIDLLV